MSKDMQGTKLLERKSTKDVPAIKRNVRDLILSPSLNKHFFTTEKTGNSERRNE